MKIYITTAAIALCAAHYAFAYPTGSMSCGEIGDFAASVVVDKQKGATLKDALDKVNKRTEGLAVERANLTRIVNAIYTDPTKSKLDEQSARLTFTAECTSN